MGANDVHDGIMRNANLFFQNANTPLVGVKAAHAVALPVVLLGGYAFIYTSFLPWMQRAALESRRVAEMLSQVSCGSNPRRGRPLPLCLFVAASIPLRNCTQRTEEGRASKLFIRLV